MAEEGEFRFRDIPEASQIFPNEINFIKTLITHPCARPWYVWVETFVPAFLLLFLTVQLFDVEDAVRAHGESIVRDRKGGKSKRHTGKLATGGARTRVNRWSQKALKTLLVVTGPLELVGFTWLLYSAVDQFFFNWQTLLEESTFCEQPIESGPMQRSRGPGFISFVESGSTVIMTDLRQNRGAWPTNVFTVELPQGLFTSGFGMTVKGPVGGVDPVWIELEVTGLFGTSKFRSDEIALAPAEEGSMSVLARFFLPGAGGGLMSWKIGGSTIPAGIEAVRGHVFVQRTG